MSGPGSRSAACLEARYHWSLERMPTRRFIEILSMQIVELPGEQIGLSVPFYWPPALAASAAGLAEPGQRCRRSSRAARRDHAAGGHATQAARGRTVMRWGPLAEAESSICMSICSSMTAIYGYTWGVYSYSSYITCYVQHA